MTDKITISSPSYEAWVQSREQYAIGTNCGWCGRGLPGGAPPLADRIVALEVELAERTRERDEAVGWIRVVGEECSSGGDRNTTLAKLRTDQRELAAERERREAAEKDAARYRWLRGDAPTHSERWPRWNLQRWDGRCWHSLDRGALDAAIDTARKD